MSCKSVPIDQPEKLQARARRCIEKPDNNRALTAGEWRWIADLLRLALAGEDVARAVGYAPRPRGRPTDYGAEYIVMHYAALRKLATKSAAKRVAKCWGITEQSVRERFKNPLWRDFANRTMCGCPPQWAIKMSEMKAAIPKSQADRGIQTAEGCRRKARTYDDLMVQLGNAISSAPRGSA